MPFLLSSLSLTARIATLTDAFSFLSCTATAAGSQRGPILFPHLFRFLFGGEAIPFSFSRRLYFGFSFGILFPDREVLVLGLHGP
jgi:hypothetical protein